MTLPQTESPLTHDLDEPMLHDEKPRKLREPNEADVILTMMLEWGCGSVQAHQRLRRMNFVDYEFHGAGGNG